MSRLRWLTSSWSVLVVLLAFMTIIVGTLLYSFRSGMLIAGTHAPLVDAAMEIKLEATTAHLWFEEIISGDRHESLDAVWHHLDQADWYAQAMLVGGENPEGRFKPLRDPLLRTKVEQVQHDLAAFRRMTEQRWAAQQTVGIGTEIDRRYDVVFRKLVGLADDVETGVQGHFADELASYRRVQGFLIVGLAALSISITLLIGRHIIVGQRTQESLRRSEATLKTVLHAAPIGIGFVTNRILGWTNHHISRMLGYSPGELEGQSARMLYETEDEFLRVSRFKHAEVARHDIGAVETRWRCKDGELKEIYLSSATIEPGHMESGLVYTAMDVTERKRAEAEARRSQEELLDHQRRERERVEAELAKAREELVRQTRLATLGQLAGSIAHELRNPLGAIRNAAYFLRGEIVGLNPKLAKHLRIIEDEVNASDRIIGDLLEMSRGKEPRKSPTDLSEIIESAWERAGIGDEIRRAVRLEPDPFEVHADRAQLGQVLANLFTNARQAIEGEGEIVVAARREGPYDDIVIRDSGSGIPAKDRDRVFEPLFSTKAKGTGLGLPICRQIVERHGGSLELAEDGECGAAFRIRLPRQ